MELKGELTVNVKYNICNIHRVGMKPERTEGKVANEPA